MLSVSQKAQSNPSSIKQAFGDRQHQPRRARDQASQQRMKKVAGLFPFGAMRSSRSHRGMDLEAALVFVGVLDIQFDEYAIAGRVR